MTQGKSVFGYLDARTTQYPTSINSYGSIDNTNQDVVSSYPRHPCSHAIIPKAYHGEERNRGAVYIYKLVRGDVVRPKPVEIHRTAPHRTVTKPLGFRGPKAVFTL